MGTCNGNVSPLSLLTAVSPGSGLPKPRFSPVHAVELRGGLSSRRVFLWAVAHGVSYEWRRCPCKAPRTCFRGAPVWKGENRVVKESLALIASCVILPGRMFNGSCCVVRLFADGTGAGDPGSALSSGTETLADGMGPERAEDEPERGRKSQGLPRLLKELLKEIEKAPRGIDQETEQDALQEGSHPTLPVSDSGTQAAPTAGTPGMNAGKSTEAAVHQSARKRYIAAVVMFPAAVLACGAVIWMCKKYLVRKREERAAEPAHADTN
ncbi:uncharacterized protein LOC125703823 isoform X4 [Lagopus muta]|uniref:uncharacterized protein LOC125703821 isoform X16 n=1 Tax=Lagopus muta TaxID=64668 RepID=UPI0020A07247|nr:uncharacterized protein LOC125703821 isoform X16 [Lagopus muta]XP_048824792.1 uncharacterized protein LOC125703821 isoform X16 [Lagopus muta]XP_048824795.1 uncharacterized protein LOC125703821 isoform X16 [Lagopus muta]XP_048824796.1 uncharacterized protein LOC125703821 isoform X16 [Lagopus muta]XP_048824802.1 uncharacterized protein LOC125703823 isoform X4 [Lagopus muta]